MTVVMLVPSLAPPSDPLEDGGIMMQKVGMFEKPNSQVVDSIS